MRYPTPGQDRGPHHPVRRSAPLAAAAVDRRRFLQLSGGAAFAAGAIAWTGGWLAPEEARSAAGEAADLYWGGTDGWIHLPPTPAIAPFHPDVLAPAPLTTYVFGFRNLTGMTQTQRLAQKNKAQHSAPLFWVPQYDPASPRDFKVTLTNLGLALRPDLFDAHTIHWHGFRNVIPFFDGEPSGSVSVPAGREFTYVYRPRDPGTYMYHCHVEDVEHVQMGMTGIVFVRPLQDGNTTLYPSGRYLYNDGDGSTGFDREFAMFLSEIWAEAHWADAHIQLPEWSDYRPDFSLLNGRVHPATLAPNGSIDPFNPEHDASGDLVAPPGHPELQYQPNSSLVTCQAGERVALRFSNLGFREAAMTTTGLPMTVVGRDATPMRGRDGTDTSYVTSTLNIGPGESYDVLFTAPPYQGGAGGHDTYLLYNRSYVRSANLAGGYGGQTTEIHVYPTGSLADQPYPNHWGL
ncbi:multicopper oxidase domain-containing protein [Nocardioides sp. GCM10027113]|uniref:multicopper oxidase domain-containing protein n=1 Tax=unclassified Nocardioides TaxID=2615069 RepID=UPI0036093F21